jgi:hypothetical protein
VKADVGEAVELPSESCIRRRDLHALHRTRAARPGEGDAASPLPASSTCRGRIAATSRQPNSDRAPDAR